MASISEFADNLMQNIFGAIYEGLYEKCNHMFGFLFFFLDNQVSWAQNEVQKPINEWNENVFNLIRGIVVDDICIPIAAVFITFIFCMELIHIMQDSNQMNSIKPQNVVFIFLKFAVCVLICSKSFEIVMGFYEIGTEAVKKLGSRTAGKLDGVLTLEDLLPAVPEKYTFGLVLTLLGDFLLILISLVIVCVLSVIIYVRIMLWFLEFLIYASAAPIPFSTFNNKEWSQVGMNYIRKMLAVSFEGFFMFLMLVMYGFIAGGLKAANSFVETLMMLIGTGFALIMLMFKAGNISASIFNAH